MIFTRAASSLYKILLCRKPDSIQQELRTQFELFKNYEMALGSMLGSREFSEMILGSLVAKSTKNWNGKKFFFLHIPKTAGTSFASALYDLSGVPAIQAYGRVGTIDRQDLKRYTFWPYLSGHALLEDFPETHRGITVFRDTKSRILSKYRQQQSLLTSHRPRPERIESWKARKKFARSATFSEWLHSKEGQAFGCMRRFIPRGFWKKQVLTNLRSYDFRSPEIITILEQSIARFDSISWCYSSDEMIDSIKNLFQVTNLNGYDFPKKNTYEAKRKYQKMNSTAYIGDCDLEILEHARESERILFEIAHEQLGLPLLSREEEDYHFDKTMKRLGFAYK